ncbi:hypothetical protein NA57DRAFT_73826 [Rhizodiscina lignyota]|uniref:Uncharacterized protein n=1 Tax=Rhizodiscina lignyota TaxID=1504668 RepID=A0A9P4M7A6_9PEZI|nr:hypothetical protein NA57DRAFT_73826 [Rhizodiscina lignyota]
MAPKIISALTLLSAFFLGVRGGYVVCDYANSIQSDIHDPTNDIGNTINQFCGDVAGWKAILNPVSHQVTSSDGMATVSFTIKNSRTSKHCQQALNDIASIFLHRQDGTGPADCQYRVGTWYSESAQDEMYELYLVENLFEPVNQGVNPATCNSQQLFKYNFGG